MDSLKDFLERKHKTIDVDGVFMRWVCRRTSISRAMKVLNLLLSYGANPVLPHPNRESTLYVCIDKDVREIAITLLEHVTDLDQPIEFVRRKTAMHCAAQRGNLEVLAYLIEKGANVNATMDFGFSPLHLAVTQSDSDVVKMLLEHGADVNAANDHGETVIHWALNFKHCHRHIHVLLEYDVDLSAVNENGRTPLHQFMYKRADSVSICEKMLSKGCDTMARDNAGNTPLHSLAWSYSSTRPYPASKLAAMLIRNGTDPNAQNFDGYTALHVSAQRGVHNPFLTAMMEEGARVDIPDNRGISAFGFYAFINNADIARDIIKYYAVKEHAGKYEFTPVLMRTIEDSVELLEYLESCREELRLMAETKVAEGVSFTLFQLLSLPAYASAQHVEGEELRATVDRSYKTFRRYSLDLTTRYREAVRRGKAERVGVEFFERYTKLNAYCIKVLVTYVPVRDLEKLNRFFERPVPEDAWSIDSETLHPTEVTQCLNL
ncbi:putative ankyrin repeat protein RF_0381 isoform X2 [Coccinella septempunctata]|nr:putative ankyrin repeat protein RF_0381 isoform X2 [Coccinella septempunctata]